jgi:hypothetical protein
MIYTVALYPAVDRELTVPEFIFDTVLRATAYPVDAVGRKLQFGARKGVTQRVVGWFFAHVEHRLK